MKKLVLGIIGGILLVVIIGAIWLYTGKFSAAKSNAFQKLSLPVAIAGAQPISGKEFVNRFQLAEILYKTDPTYKAADTEGQILDELISNAKLERIASAHKVSAGSADIDAEFKDIVNQFAAGDSAKFMGILDQTYHLNAGDFKSKIIRPDVLKTNLTIWFNGQKDFNKPAFDKQQELMDKLKGGQAFEDVVKVYTQDAATKDFGGDAGFVKASDLSPEFQAPLASAKPGDLLTITSRFGLHIVKVVEIDKSGSEPSYHIQQIFIKEDGFDDWFSKQSDAIKSHKFIKF